MTSTARPTVSSTRSATRTADVVVIGAGVVGAACAYFASRAGLRTVVLDRSSVAAGTTSGGEGNILVSDKEPGPELQLALYAQSVWRSDLAEHGSLWELESKGGVVVARTPSASTALRRLTAAQRAHGIDGVDLDPDRLTDYEPALATGFAGGAFYPQDAQVQPMLVATHLIRLARAAGAELLLGTEVIGFVRHVDRVSGVRTNRGQIHADHVINAAGTWAGEVARLAHVAVPVLPRRGFILVTQPVRPDPTGAPLVRHKVYSADYVDHVASSAADLQTSPVIEGTPSGPILIGSSRERVGFDHTISPRALARLAAAAIDLFPGLAGIQVLRHYHGFRPYCPDHLPVIGPDPRAPGLLHACGHEGAGIGLSAATGALLADHLVGRPPQVDLAPFAPERFASATGSDRG